MLIQELVTLETVEKLYQPSSQLVPNVSNCGLTTVTKLQVELPRQF